MMWKVIAIVGAALIISEIFGLFLSAWPTVHDIFPIDLRPLFWGDVQYRKVVNSDSFNLGKYVPLVFGILLFVAGIIKTMNVR